MLSLQYLPVTFTAHLINFSVFFLRFPFRQLLSSSSRILHCGFRFRCRNVLWCAECLSISGIDSTIQREQETVIVPSFDKIFFVIIVDFSFLKICSVSIATICSLLSCAWEILFCFMGFSFIDCYVCRTGFLRFGPTKGNYSRMFSEFVPATLCMRYLLKQRMSFKIAITYHYILRFTVTDRWSQS